MDSPPTHTLTQLHAGWGPPAELGGLWLQAHVSFILHVGETSELHGYAVRAQGALGVFSSALLRTADAWAKLSHFSASWV